MKTLNVHISNTPQNMYVSAEIEVAGLGKISIKDCISQETIARVFAEAEVTLKTKLGQKL